MSVRIDLQLPSLSAEQQRRLHGALECLALPAGEVWVISVLENRAPDDEWLLLVTGGVERTRPAEGWAFVAVEETGDGDRVCTYARRLPAAAQSPDAVAETVARLLEIVPARRARFA